MRRAVLPATLAAVVLSPGAADALVQVDRGIAGVRVDATEAQVRDALGPPTRRLTGRNPFGRYVELRHAGGLRVLLQGGRRVSSVSTTGLGDRTARGIGVGSREARVDALVPGVRCETIAGARTCHTRSFLPGTVVTDFTIRRGRVTRITVGRVID